MQIRMNNKKSVLNSNSSYSKLNQPLVPVKGYENLRKPATSNKLESNLKNLEEKGE